jgi:hypothetical protein
MAKITCEEAKEQIDLVEYLYHLGYKPARVSRENYYYHSPLRQERTPSFSVNRLKGVWYDHGTGEGGSIIDFGIRYFDCDIPQLLEILEASVPVHHHYPAIIPSAVKADEGKVKIIHEEKLSAPVLISYLAERRIPADIAGKYCSEVHYQINGRSYFAIGFKNNSGGYELRNPFFKGSSSPKDVTYIDNGYDALAVFEGFFDFLSYVFIQQNNQLSAASFLVMNSIALAEKAGPFFERHTQVNLYLDNDAGGKRLTASLVEKDARFKDRSQLYAKFNDLNDWLNRPVGKPFKIRRNRI